MVTIQITDATITGQGARPSSIKEGSDINVVPEKALKGEAKSHQIKYIRLREYACKTAIN